MDPNKQIEVARVGLRNIGPRIEKIRQELEPLIQAYMKLMKLKWAAEEQLIQVKHIPAGMTRAKMKKEEQSFKKAVDQMSDEQKAKLVAELEAHLLERRKANANSTC